MAWPSRAVLGSRPALTKLSLDKTPTALAAAAKRRWMLARRWSRQAEPRVINTLRREP